MHRVARVVGAGTGNDRDRDRLDHRREQAQSLVVGEDGRLPRRAGEDQTVVPVRLQMPRQRDCDVEIELAVVVERRDHRREDSTEVGHAPIVRPTQRVTVRCCRMTNDSDGPLIGILACDHVGPELRDASSGRDYDDMYEQMLRAAEPTVRTRTYDVVNGELPAGPDECDGWIVTGARYDAYRDEPWIVALRKFVTSVLEHRARL